MATASRPDCRQQLGRGCDQNPGWRKHVIAAEEPSAPITRWRIDGDGRNDVVALRTLRRLVPQSRLGMASSTVEAATSDADLGDGSERRGPRPVAFGRRQSVFLYLQRAASARSAALRFHPARA
jgi:hypothetical protein